MSQNVAILTLKVRSFDFLIYTNEYEFMGEPFVQ